MNKRMKERIRGVKSWLPGRSKRRWAQLTVRQRSCPRVYKQWRATRVDFQGACEDKTPSTVVIVTLEMCDSRIKVSQQPAASRLALRKASVKRIGEGRQRIRPAGLVRASFLPPPPQSAPSGARKEIPGHRLHRPTVSIPSPNLPLHPHIQVFSVWLKVLTAREAEKQFPVNQVPMSFCFFLILLPQIPSPPYLCESVHS